MEQVRAIAAERSLELDSPDLPRVLDELDELRAYRSQFHFPVREGHGAADASVGDRHYRFFCGNSLGLQHVDVSSTVQAELTKWQTQAVEGHFLQPNPWFEIDDILRKDMAAIVGAEESEVVIMNTLTVNLHLLMAAFYKPQGGRRKIMAESFPFPSDTHAFVSQIEFHGGNPATDLISVFASTGPDGKANEAPAVIPTEAFLQAIEQHGDEVAVLILGAVHFLTGQFFDIATIAKAAHAKGIIVGVDCAHAVGNVPLYLHDWDVDFACWCTYKYLNAGPGNIAGAFVHSKHTAADSPSVKQFRGWWGHQRSNRFSLHKEFDSSPGAASFQLSNPCVLSIMSLAPSLKLCAKIGMPTLRAKSLMLTGYMEHLIKTKLSGAVEIVTPADPSQRGAQLSIRILPGKLAPGKVASSAAYQCGNDLNNDADLAQRLLLEAGVMCDNRPPDILRLAPVPTYNSFEDVYELIVRLKALF